MGKRANVAGAIETVQSGDHVSIRKKLLQDGTWSLFLAIHRPGRPREYRSLELRLTGGRDADREVMTRARVILSQLEEDLRAERRGEISTLRGRIGLMQFLQHVMAERQGAARRYRPILPHLIACFGDAPVPLDRISPAMCSAFREHLEASSLSRNSQAQYYQRFTALLNHAVRMRMLRSNPAQHVERIRESPTPRRFLTIGEVQMLTACAGRHGDVARAFLFSCATGLRISDIRALTWANVSRSAVRLMMQKTGTEILVPLNATALQLLGTAGDPDMRVFDVPTTSARLGRALLLWANDAGVRSFTYHASRHSFATLLITAGVDVYAVSKLLGHASVKHTELYVRLLDERKRAAVDALPSFELGVNWPDAAELAN